MMKKWCLATLASAVLGFSLGAATLNVSDSAGLRSALSSAASGDTIQLAAGTYTGPFTSGGKSLTFSVAGAVAISGLSVTEAQETRFIGSGAAASSLALSNASFLNCGYGSTVAFAEDKYANAWDADFDRAVVLFKDLKAKVSATTFAGSRMITSRNFGGPIVLVKGDAGGSSFSGCEWKGNDEVYSLTSVREGINDWHEFAPSGCCRAGSLVVETASPDAEVSLSGCTFGYNVMTAGWTAGLNVRSGAVTVGGDSVFWGNVASRSYSHHADLDVGYQGSIRVTSAVFAAEDELYVPLNDALVDLSGAKYGDPKFTTTPADVFAGLTTAAGGKSVLAQETFPIADTNGVAAASGNFFHYFKGEYPRAMINLKKGASSFVAGSWRPITTGDSASSEIWAKKTLGIRPAKLEWRLMGSQAGTGPEGGADGVMRSDGRDVQFYRHRFDTAWDAHRSDDNTFSVAYPKDAGAGAAKPQGRPLLVSLHSRGGGKPSGGVYSTTGFTTATPQTTASPDSPYEAPDDAYVLSLDCMENHVYDFWWGSMPSAEPWAASPAGLPAGYYYTWTMWGVIKGQLFYGPVGPEGWTRNGAFENIPSSDLPSESNLVYLFRTNEKGSACEQRVLDTIEWVVRKYGIDRNRIYLAGNSMGGQGTLAIGLRHGEVFAAIEGNVPATIWFPAVRMGFVDANGNPVAKDAYTPPAYDPPVCVDWSGSNDAWSRDHDVIYDGMNRFRFNFIGLWGDHGHIQSYTQGRAKNDLINTFDRFEIKRNEAYAAFSNAQSNDPIPWPQQSYVNGDLLDPDTPTQIIDGHEVERGGLVIRDGSVIAGQVNAWFRWKVLKDTSDEFQMQLWIADGQEVPSKQFLRPQSTRVDVTPRRLQNFRASGNVEWTFGDYCRGVAAKDATLGVWTMEQLPLAVGVPLTLTMKPTTQSATGTIVDPALVDIPTFAPTKPYTGDLQKADVAETDGYTVTGNGGIVNVGETETITLTLKTGKVWADLTTRPKTFSFSLTQAENAWTREPSMSANFWLMGGAPATLDVGAAKFGAPVSAYPETGFKAMGDGVYANVISVPETKNYKGLEFKLPFTVYPGGTVDGVEFAYAKSATYWTDNVLTFYDTDQVGGIAFKTNTNVRILLVGGGGGGGIRGGGGGAGGFIDETVTIPAGTYFVRIGAGGKPGEGAMGQSGYNVTAYPTRGGNTALYQVNGTVTNFVYLAHGGGGGSVWNNGSTVAEPTSGGSGGGGGLKSQSAVMNGAASTASGIEKGNRGGTGVGGYNNGGAGGGGGAGEPGHEASGAGIFTGGAGGNGLVSNITGDEIWYAGGGGGGCDEDALGASGGAGGAGGGGRGGNFNTRGTAGVVGFGGGGGGGGGGSQNVTAGGRGGSGLAIIRFYSPTAFDPKAVAPRPKADLVYNGFEQVGVEAGKGYTLSGEIAATEAGAHTATATLAAGYTWSDNYAEQSRLVIWQIAKAENAWATAPAISTATWAVDEAPGRLTVPVPVYGRDTMTATMDDRLWDGVSLPTEVGEHVAKWAVPAGANALALEGSVSFTITSGPMLPKVVPTNTRTAEIGNGDLIVFVGDSITNFGNERNATGYVHIVTNVLKRVKGVSVKFLPAGINNMQSSDMAKLFTEHGLNKMPAGFAGKKWMTLMCGVNDCNGLQGWGFRPSESYRENVNATLDLAAKNGFSSILMTPSAQNDNLYYGDNAFLTRPSNNVNFPQTTGDLQRQKSNWYEVTHYIPVLQEIAEERGIPLADVHAVLWEMAAKEHHRFLPDNDLHPNTFGNFCIARALLRSMGCADADIDAAFAAIIAEGGIFIPDEPEYTGGEASNAFYPARMADDVAGVASFNAVVSTPSSPTFVDYVANGGAAYVDTDFELDGEDLVSARVRFNSVGGNAAVWCARNPNHSGNAATSFSCFRSGTSWRYDHLDSPRADGPTFGTVAKDTAYDLWAYGYAFKVGAAEIGEFYALPWQGTTKGKVRLFAGYTATAAVTDVADMRLYGFKVSTADGTVKHDLVPATDGGVAGLYDKVTKKFYKSSNQAALTAGPVKNGKLRYDFPVPAAGLVYNGQTQCGVASGAGYTVTGGAETEADTYTATAALADKASTEWEDGTTGDKTFSWSIAQAENAWMVEPAVSSLAWTLGADEPTVTKGVAKFGTAVMRLDGAEWLGDLPKAAGTYTLSCEAAASKSWTALSKSFTLTVSNPKQEGPVIFAGATTNWADGDLVLTYTDTASAGLFKLTEQSTVRMLLIGGGGSGGRNAVGGNGGNAGTVVEYRDFVLSAGAYAVTVGKGGAVPDAEKSGLAGGLSMLSGAGQKFKAAGGAGGVAANPPNQMASAGGRGAGGAGGGNTYQHGGKGGAAIANDITGTLKAYAGGGGGAGANSNAGAGGSVTIDGKTVTVGGRGKTVMGADATAGVANTGSGGGGAANKELSAAGGDGVVIIRVGMNPCDHDWEQKAGKDATCVDDGYTAYEQCALCGLVRGKTVIPATGEHHYVEGFCDVCGQPEPHVHDAGYEVPAVEASCTNVGYTAGVRCGRCDAILSGCTLIPLAPHQYDAQGVCTVCHQQGPVPLRRDDISSSGAKETVDGSYLVLVYDDPANGGTLTLKKTGAAQILIVGGGAGGVGANYGGGGGGGAVVTQSVDFAGGVTYAVQVGAGGAVDANGADSSIAGGGLQFVAAGGKVGSGVNGGISGAGKSGASGNAGYQYGGGGGGASGAGAGGTNQNGGAGGAGVKSDITGTLLGYGGGGGGGGGVGQGAGTDGGANGGAAAKAGLGGGGGGQKLFGVAGAGGSGVVIVRIAFIDDSRQQNSWTTPPAISKPTWVTGDEPGVFTWPVAAYGTVSATMDGEAWGEGAALPTSVGSHAIVVSVPETDKYTGLSDTITFTITDKAHVHEWIGPAIQPATCTEPGLKTWICSGCEVVSNEVIVAHGHHFVNGECEYCHEKQSSPGTLDDIEFTGAETNWVDGELVLVYGDIAAGGTLKLKSAMTGRVLVVGGGAGGVGTNYGGGGGGGAVVTQAVDFAGGVTYTMTVGAGGAVDASGAASSIAGGALDLVAAGGKVGNGANGGMSGAGKSGATGNVNYQYGGGGGGASGAGAAGTYQNGGAGGAGVKSDIAGSSLGYGGGGGGGGGVGQGSGRDGGANGGETAKAGFGGGGGGQKLFGLAGAGGSGVVIVRLKIAAPGPTPTWDVPGEQGSGIQGFPGEDGKAYVEFSAIEFTGEGLKVKLSAKKIVADGQTFGIVCKTDLLGDEKIVVNATLHADATGTEGELRTVSDLSPYSQLFVVGVGPKAEE